MRSHRDFVPVYADDLKWFLDTELLAEKRVRKSFLMLAKKREHGKTYLKADDWFVEAISQLPIRALTTGQGKPEWFFQRKFSLTSSTTDKAIAACKGNEDWLEHHESWRRILAILSPTGAVLEVAEQGIEEDTSEPQSEQQVTGQVIPFTLQDLLTDLSIRNHPCCFWLAIKKGRSFTDCL